MDAARSRQGSARGAQTGRLERATLMSRSEDRERKKCRPGKKRERFTRPKAAPGPCLAAIRSRCSASVTEVLPVFERIGRNLDRALPRKGFDELILGHGDRLAAAVSDAAWRKHVLVTQYSYYEIRHAVCEAYDLLRAHAADGFDPTCSVRKDFANWSRLTRPVQQHEFFAETDLYLHGCVAATLALLPDKCAEIGSLLASKQVPALLIALNSSGATPHNPCSLGVMVIAVQDWARPNGPVAGHA
ncbi:hypothetical protein OOZ54_08125 [Rhodopseudomonas palustris]|uniref:hypothetical protein n=1 Tax=Rhodopseudomonas palustris TaxID=1076 RepID=UPI0022F0EFD7|nr:hypothetical protein [Rhodopseudomonas palustris]WBU31454.1 hypothetical protein OOZ54_08125 [Rhodopseudomonas palustris]